MDPTQNQPVQPAPTEKKSFGPLVGIIVIVIALALGAFYVWGGKLSSTTEETVAATSTPAAEVMETSTTASATSTTVVKTATSTTVTVTATTTTTTR